MNRFLHLWTWLWFLSSPFVALLGWINGYNSGDTSAAVLGFINLGMSGAFLCLLKKMDE